MKESTYLPKIRTEKQRLWVVTECYFPEVVSTGQYLTQLAEGLTDSFDVKVICGQPNYLARGTRAVNREVRNGVEIFRVWSALFDKNVIANRVVNMLTLGLSIFLRSLRSFRKGDKVLVVTAPPNLPFTIAIASLLKGSAYTLLIHDYYPDQLVALGKFRSNSLIVRLMHFANSWLFKYTTRIIVVGRDMADLVGARIHGLDVPISVIPNWGDVDEIRPEVKETNALIRELNVESRLVVLSAGNIGRPTAIETVAEGARRLKDDPRFHFIFVGWGAKGSWLSEFVRDHGLTNVSVLGQKPRSEQQNFLNACDIGLVSLAAGMWGTAMPSRTYNLLAAGKPILGLCDEDSELHRVLVEDNIGWRVPPNEPEMLRETLIAIYEGREGISEIGKRARIAAERKYSLKNALVRYREALK